MSRATELNKFCHRFIIHGTERDYFLSILVKLVIVCNEAPQLDSDTSLISVLMKYE